MIIGHYLLSNPSPVDRDFSSAHYSALQVWRNYMRHLLGVSDNWDPLVITCFEELCLFILATDIAILTNSLWRSQTTFPQVQQNSVHHAVSALLSLSSLLKTDRWCCGLKYVQAGSVCDRDGWERVKDLYSKDLTSGRWNTSNKFSLSSMGWEVIYIASQKTVLGDDQSVILNTLNWFFLLLCLTPLCSMWLYYLKK